jgi:hypothetical protein
MKIDLGLKIYRTNFPKVGQIIELKTIDEAGLIKPGFFGRLAFSKLKTTPNDEIYWMKNCAIECTRFDSYTFDGYELYGFHGHATPGFGIDAQTEIGRGPGSMWGNTIVVFISPDCFFKKVIFQVIMNKGVAELYLQQFRQLCTKAFGPPKVATEEFYIWKDGETSVKSARNGNDAVFEWRLV